MDIKKYLGETGDNQPQDYQQWYDIIQPTTVNIILGRKRRGKSALGYFLLENISKHYDLSPVVVNLPREKQHLLPSDFIIRSLEELTNIENSIALIDEGTTMLPAGQRKLEEMVKGFQSMSGQRNQIILFVFHASSDVGSRILRGVDAVLLKEPSQRQIQHGSKDTWWHELLLESKSKFKTVADMGQDKRKFTFVDCDDPEFHGLLPNSLCSFWSEELSKAWAGTRIGIETEPQENLGQPQQLELSPEGLRKKMKDQGLQDPYWHNVSELQAMCKERGLPTTGKKDDLVLRLFAYPKVEELKQQALLTEGKCRICGKEGKLYSETCEECFASWGFAVVKNRMN